MRDAWKTKKSCPRNESSNLRHNRKSSALVHDVADALKELAVHKLGAKIVSSLLVRAAVKRHAERVSIFGRGLGWQLHVKSVGTLLEMRFSIAA